MGRIDPSEEVESPVKGVDVASYPQSYETPQPQPQPVGRPWSTGLFDCHLDQTNGNITAFV